MHIHDFQLLTASIAFAYDLVFVPFTGPSNWRGFSQTALSLDIPD